MGFSGHREAGLWHGQAEHTVLVQKNLRGKDIQHCLLGHDCHRIGVVSVILSGDCVRMQPAIYGMESKSEGPADPVYQVWPHVHRNKGLSLTLYQDRQNAPGVRLV